jgi:hypothetical protein
MKSLSLILSTLAMMQSESPVSSNTYVMGTINLRNSKRVVRKEVFLSHSKVTTVKVYICIYNLVAVVQNSVNSVEINTYVFHVST